MFNAIEALQRDVIDAKFSRLTAAAVLLISILFYNDAERLEDKIRHIVLKKYILFKNFQPNY